MHVCMYACMHVCMYACMHACMHACMYVCVYVCMYVRTDTTSEYLSLSLSVSLCLARDPVSLLENFCLGSEVKSGELPLREGIKECCRIPSAVGLRHRIRWRQIVQFCQELISAADAAGWQLAVCSTSNEVRLRRSARGTSVRHVILRSVEASVRAVVETMLPDFADKIKIFAGDVVAAKKPDPATRLKVVVSLGLLEGWCSFEPFFL